MSLGNTLTEEGTTLFRECIDGGYVLLGWGVTSTGLLPNIANCKR